MCNSPEKILNKYLYRAPESQWFVSKYWDIKSIFCLRHRFGEKKIWNKVKYSGFDHEKIFNHNVETDMKKKKKFFSFLTPVSDF